MKAKWLCALVAAVAASSASHAYADTFSCSSVTTHATNAISEARETTSARKAVEIFTALAPLVEGACSDDAQLDVKGSDTLAPHAAAHPGPDPDPTTPPTPSPRPTQSPECKSATDRYLRLQSMLENANKQLADLQDELKQKLREHRTKKPAVDKLTEQHKITEGLYQQAVKRIAALYPKWEATLHLYKHWDGTWSGWISKYPRTEWVRILDKYEDDLHAISKKLTPLLAELNAIARDIVRLKTQVKEAQQHVDNLVRLQESLYKKMTEACKK